ncbi:MAG: hypothetical protein K2O34_09140, partial [Acetatifactor sp.]|nr:hypothetical protein [Acetatifactor sp.]
MKWLKKWSFVTILMITGIFYCVADKSLLKRTYQENMDMVGEEKPEESWQQLEGVDIPESVSGNLASEESLPAEPEGGATEPQMPESDVPSESESAEQDVPVPEETLPPEPEIRFGRVEDDYFADALFLGDSRTVGMKEYGGLG